MDGYILIHEITDGGIMANKKGLVSISFRSKSVEEIALAASEAGLEAIEWGGDVHVPHGDTEAAKNAAEICKKYGLSIPHYGSYYKMGYSDPAMFEGVLECARILGAPIIRVWAGLGIHPDTLPREDYERIVDDARRICDMAGDIIVATECHSDSITEHYEYALKLFEDVGRDNFKTFWQPNQHHGFEYDLLAAKALLPYTVGVHVFNWFGEKPDKYPLDRNPEKWQAYMEILKAKELNYMLEFMPDDKIETLPREAQALDTFIKEYLI